MKLQFHTTGNLPNSPELRPHRPHYSTPGSFGEQLAAINLFGQLPKRLKASRHDREIVWQTVRAIIMPHVMGAST